MNMQANFENSGRGLQIAGNSADRMRLRSRVGVAFFNGVVCEIIHNVGILRSIFSKLVSGGKCERVNPIDSCDVRTSPGYVAF